MPLVLKFLLLQSIYKFVLELFAQSWQLHSSFLCNFFNTIYFYHSYSYCPSCNCSNFCLDYTSIEFYLKSCISLMAFYLLFTFAINWIEIYSVSLIKCNYYFYGCLLKAICTYCSYIISISIDNLFESLYVIPQCRFCRSSASPCVAKESKLGLSKNNKSVVCCRY